MRSLLINKSLAYYRTFHSYISKREYYARYIEMDYSVLGALHTKTSSQAIRVEHRIQVQRLSFYSNRLRVLLQLGLPKCRFVLTTGKQAHRVYVYKSVFGKYCCYISCHFLKGQLVFVQLCFPQGEQELQKEVLEVLQKKYGFMVNAEVEELHLYNRDGERLIMQNDIHLRLYYYSGNPSFLYYLKQMQEVELERIQNRVVQHAQQLEALL